MGRAPFVRREGHGFRKLIFLKQFSNRVQIKGRYGILYTKPGGKAGRGGGFVERLGKVLGRLLFPGLGVALVCVPVAAALLGYTFGSGQEEGPAAWLSYGFSAYALTILCAWTAKNAGRARREVHAAIHRVPVAHRYVTDVSFKLHVSLYLSLGLNLLYAGMKLVYGVRFRSVWFGTLAVYYMTLALMRFLLLWQVNHTGFDGETASQLRRYRLCGWILLLMNIALSGVVVLMVRREEGFAYPGYLIYVMAMYAFYNIITAVRDVVKYRKFQSPLMSAGKAIKLAAALVSMLSLETAMLTQFDNGENPAAFRRVMTGTTGGCVCLGVLAMAVYMIATATGRLRRMEYQKGGTTNGEHSGAGG